MHLSGQVRVKWIGEWVDGQCMYFRPLDLSRIPTNNGAESAKIQQMYENAHPNLALVLLFERTEVECGKGILFEKKKKKKKKI